MKKKNAFTLIELLAVILVIGILLIIAVPQVMKIMKKGTKSYYHSIENTMKTAGMDYMETYRTLLPREIGNVEIVELSELMDNNFIDKVTDEKGNLCEGKVAVQKVKKDSYIYHSCLICGDYYESEQQDCEYSVSNNHYADSGNYKVVVAPDYYEVGQLEEFVSPYARVYYIDSQGNENQIKDDLKGSPYKVETKTIGEKKVKYYYHGATAEITVNVKEDDAPTKPQVVIKTENSNGKSYKGNWYSGNIYVKFKSTDYAKQGVAGSGIDHYEVANSKNGPFTPISGNSETYRNEGSYTKYVRAVDKSGNISPVTSYEIKIDKTAPTCVWTGESTDWQPKVSQYPSATDRANYKRTITATCNDKKGSIATSGCSTNSVSKTFSYSASEQTHNQAHTIIDNAGNYKDCTTDLNVYIDKVEPTITPKNLTLDKRDYSFTNTVVHGDQHSGISYFACDPANSKKTGSYTVTCTAIDGVGLSTTKSFTVTHSYPATEYDCGYSCPVDEVPCSQETCPDDDDCYHQSASTGHDCCPVAMRYSCRYSCPNGGTLNENNKRCYY